MRVSPEKIDEMYPKGSVGDESSFTDLLNLRSQSGESSGGMGGRMGGNVGDNVIEGRIISISDDFVLIDVQEKKEGRMSVSEIKDSDGGLMFKEGDAILVHVSKEGGRLKISHKKALKHKKIAEEIKSLGADYKDKIVEGVITSKNKGGFVVESNGGVEYFMPRKYSGIRDDEREYHGKNVKACVVDVRPENDSIIISRKRYFDINNATQKESARKIMESGLAYDGVVKSVTDFGIFVDVGEDGASIEGLVHLSEISHKGRVNPHKLYKVGDKVQVKPLEYNEEKNKLSFSIRALFDDPWKDIGDDIKVGYVIRVSVSNIESYGAFVDLGNGIEGFLHISEISWDKGVKEINDVLKIGDEIDVEVIEIDSNNRKLRVSLKKTQDKPFNRFLKKYKVGDLVSGKVATITNFGAFVNLGFIDGLLHNEDAFWDKSQKCLDVFKVGDEIEVKIEKIDRENEKISLNRKYLTSSPCEEFAKSHKLDDEVTGKVIDIKDFGVFVKIDDSNIDALIRNEDMDKHTKEELKIGDEIKGVIVSINNKTNRVRLSIRRFHKKEEQKKLKRFNSNEKATLGDMIKNKDVLKNLEGLSEG